MPTYVYRCQACGEQVEVIQRFSDGPLTICPHCGGSLQRLLFPPALIFKGSGWYITDSRNASPGNGSGQDRKTGVPTGPSETKEAPSVPAKED